MKHQRNRLIWLALVTLIGFPLVGFFGVTLLTTKAALPLMFRTVAPLWQQLLWGAILGTGGGFLARAYISIPWMQPIAEKYGALIGSLLLNWKQIIFISICAGIGEELLFRGAIQPFWGIWLTALVFVFIHGYLNPFNLRIFTYGIIMTLIIVLVGFSANRLGIWSAALAHAIIDLILFQFLVASFKSNPSVDETDFSQVQNREHEDNAESNEFFVETDKNS